MKTKINTNMNKLLPQSQLCSSVAKSQFQFYHHRINSFHINTPTSTATQNVGHQIDVTRTLRDVWMVWKHKERAAFCDRKTPHCNGATVNAACSSSSQQEHHQLVAKCWIRFQLQEDARRMHAAPQGSRGQTFMHVPQLQAQPPTPGCLSLPRQSWGNMLQEARSVTWHGQKHTREREGGGREEETVPRSQLFPIIWGEDTHRVRRDWPKQPPPVSQWS